MDSISKKYIFFLNDWVNASEKFMYTCPDRIDLMCYGTGYNNWGVQTNQKAFAAIAVLASEPHLPNRGNLLEKSLRLLRFSLESHIEGSYQCLDGTSWGHTWISALGIERMMHGVDAIEEYLTSEDKELLKRVLISEADWLTDHYPVQAGEVENNKPESNIWNGALLQRVSSMYPDADRKNEYREKGNSFLLNGISVPSDKTNADIIDGKAISNWHIGANFFETFALNHQRYLNIGYMVICLSNIAMLHFMYKKRGLTPPKALYHHVGELWRLIKACTFPDGRLIRIGGDTRVRYCYCQDYAICAWLFAKDYLHDSDCEIFEREWLKTLQTEVENNGDGLFLSERCGELEDISPVYYTRLESDRAISLSYSVYWRRLFSNLNEKCNKMKLSPIKMSWSDPYHGACFQRGENRIASWVWRAAEPPQGMCLPLGKSNMVEWRQNLAGMIEGLGNIHSASMIDNEVSMFDGGFLTVGTISIENEHFVAEGQSKECVAIEWIACAALPDDCTMIVMQFAKTVTRSYLKSVKGLNMHIPNDIFNNKRRIYHTSNGIFELEGLSSSAEIINTKSKWLNIDEILSVISVYGSDSLVINRSSKRKIGLKRYSYLDNSNNTGMLYTDEICSSCNLGLQSIDKAKVLIDTGFIVLAGLSSAETKKYIQADSFKSIELKENSIRCMTAKDTAGESYMLVSNFSENSCEVSILYEGIESMQNIADKCEIINNKRNIFKFNLQKNSAKLFKLKTAKFF